MHGSTDLHGMARARFFVEDEEVVAAGAERRHRVVMLVNPQPDRVPVVRERALEIGHGEVDRADGRGAGFAGQGRHEEDEKGEQAPGHGAGP